MSLYHLDADYLIGFAELFHDHHERAFNDLREWSIAGHVLGASAVAWREFCSGKSRPRPPLEVENARAMLHAQVIRYGPKQAEKAAELFNQTGRSKRLKRDCDIAATAIISRARLASFNLDDFKRFVPFGLRIVNYTPFLDPSDRRQENYLEDRRAG